VPKRILILGAGFAGLQATFHLDRSFRSRADVDIVLVNEHNYFMFTPLLPQVVSSYLNPRHIVQPVRDIRGSRRFRFLRDSVTAIDLNRREALVASGPLPYDYLVLAPGSRSDFFGIPGAAEHTTQLKTLEDGVVLRERVLDLCEHADHTSDAAERRRLMTFVVVGGGYTGVELMGELEDFLFGYVTRHYRGISAADLRLVLLEATSEILGGVHPSLARHALARLRKHGIEIRTGARVISVSSSAVEIGGNEVIPAATVIWTAGVRAHRLIEALPGPHDRSGRAVVNEHLQLEGHPEVFVAGDSCAAVTAAAAPRVAPVAMEQGRIAARNIVALEAGAPLASYQYVSQGTLIALGMNYAVVEVFGVKFRGYFAWLFWNAVHLFKLVGFKKQVQVSLDWILGSLFPRDAAMIRPARGCPLCEKARTRSGLQGGSAPPYSVS
jgi:NADH dehydrogenase